MILKWNTAVNSIYPELQYERAISQQQNIKSDFGTDLGLIWTLCSKESPSINLHLSKTVLKILNLYIFRPAYGNTDYSHWLISSLKWCLHLFEVQQCVLRPFDVADDPPWHLVRGGIVVLGKGQEKSQNPDHPNNHLCLSCRHPLLQGMDDGHVSVGEQQNPV